MSQTQNIIVTGASRGLGRAMVELLINENTNVNVTAIARNGKALAELAATFNAEDRHRILTVEGDVTEQASVDKAINQTLEKWGNIHGVIFNAGVLSPVGHLYDTEYDVEQMKKLFDVNFFSVVNFTHALIKKLRIKPDCERSEPLNVVFVSSSASVKAYDGWLAYCASKASMNTLCMHLHSECFPSLKAVSVDPGIVDTGMQKDIRDKLGENMTADAVSQFQGFYEDKKLLDPLTVAKAYTKLALNIPQELSGKYIVWDEAL